MYINPKWQCWITIICRKYNKLYHYVLSKIHFSFNSNNEWIFTQKHISNSKNEIAYYCTKEVSITYKPAETKIAWLAKEMKYKHNSSFPMLWPVTNMCNIWILRNFKHWSCILCLDFLVYSEVCLRYPSEPIGHHTVTRLCIYEEISSTKNEKSGIISYF